MKIKSILSLLAIVALALIAFVSSSHAQAATDPVVLVPSVPFYENGTFWTAVLGFVSFVVALWKNQQLTTVQKILQATVQGVEVATKIPAIQEFEQTIKKTIQTKAIQLGIEPLLNEIVKDLTPPAPVQVPASASVL